MTVMVMMTVMLITMVMKHGYKDDKFDDDSGDGASVVDYFDIIHVEHNEDNNDL